MMRKTELKLYSFAIFTVFILFFTHMQIDVENYLFEIFSKMNFGRKLSMNIPVRINLNLNLDRILLFVKNVDCSPLFSEKKVQFSILSLHCSYPAITTFGTNQNN